MIIGYARVSTLEQNLELQRQALQRQGCECIYQDHGVSGGTQSRPGLDRALRRMKAGDTLVVWRLDRLGRSLVHLVQLLEMLSKRQVCFHSITEHIDTRSSGGRLVFHMMAALAEFERSLISERTRAGIAAARASGRAFGRPLLLSPEQANAARELIEQDGWSLRDAAAHMAVHPRTLQRMLDRKVQVCGSNGAPADVKAM